MTQITLRVEQVNPRGISVTCNTKAYIHHSNVRTGAAAWSQTMAARRTREQTSRGRTTTG